MFTVYKIKSMISDKVYIGYTSKNMLTRFEEHIKASEKGSNQKLKRAIRNHGKENFIIENLENTDSKSKAIELEIFYITYYNSRNDGYNMTRGGEGSDWSRGLTYDEMYSAEIAEKKKNSMRGDNNPSRKNDVSGKNNGFYGNIHSEDSKKKIGEASRRRTHNKETRKKISENMKNNNPMKDKCGISHHGSKAYKIYNPLENKEIIIVGGAAKYLSKYGITLQTLLKRMSGIIPIRNKEKYKDTKWKIYEIDKNTL